LPSSPELTQFRTKVSVGTTLSRHEVVEIITGAISEKRALIAYKDHGRFSEARSVHQKIRLGRRKLAAERIWAWGTKGIINRVGDDISTEFITRLT
jgi:hypothetical protein